MLFCPDDLYLIRAGASARRRFLDTALCQLRPNYDKVLSEYEKLLAHKNKILKDSEEKPEFLELLDDFSLRMAHLGAIIIRYRAYYIRKLSEKAAAVHREAAPHETLGAVYQTVSAVTDPFAGAAEIERELIEHVMSHKKFELAARTCLSGPHKDDLDLTINGVSASSYGSQGQVRTCALHVMSHKKFELAARTCLSGPHKDDLDLTINGVSASSYGSQGQVRTCALALKLAEREMFFEDCGEYPVLLLDDVLSELDRQRQDFVLNRIAEGQVIITCCEEDIAAKIDAGCLFTVQNGKIIGESRTQKDARV